jgi:endonuclease/exonuclease/phosphatase (EEP) superfamily protein YafD
VPRLILMIALASLAAALAAQGGRWFVGLDLLADLAPIWLAASTLCLLAGSQMGVGPRAPVLFVAVAGVAASAALIVPEFTRSISSAKPRDDCERLRVVQLNVGGDGLADPGRVADWIAVQAPELVFLDDGDAALRAAMARKGFYWRNGPGWTAIASRQPLQPGSALGPPGALPDLTTATYGQGERRADLIGAHIARPFVTGPLAAKATLPRLVAFVGAYPQSRRMIMAGDFNLAPWSFQLRRLDAALPLERRDRSLFTWPARLGARSWPLPAAPLDHIYAGADWRTTAASLGPPLGSTHRPVLVDLQSCPDYQRAG